MSTNSFAFLSPQSDNGCKDYALLAVIMEQVEYEVSYTDEEAHVARRFYYDSCMEAGGAENIGNPIFI